MTHPRIVHLSDPHFGTEDPLLIAPLLQAITDLRPEVIVLSGDLTQRARPDQFAAAARFITACPAPVLAIPGNHDTPLFNLVQRLARPWQRWQHAIGALEPVIETPHLLVVGLNTANPRAWKDGRITPAQTARLARLMAQAGPRRRILAMHHPLQGPPSAPPALQGAQAAIPAILAAGVEIVLSGHLHSTYAAPVPAAPGLLSVQAGTCLSDRMRQDGRAFTSLSLHPGGVTLTHHRAQPDRTYRADADWTLARTPAGWVDRPAESSAPRG